MGHLAGDKYITITTEIIKNVIELKGHVARIGGDEFVILLEYVDIQELQLIFLKKDKRYINFQPHQIPE